MRQHESGDTSIVDSTRAHRRFAHLLGYAGAAVVPVLVCLAFLSPEISDIVRRVSVVYGAAILAFLGGIQWGLSMSSSEPRVRLRRLVVSMVPPLWSVMALSLPTGVCTLLLISGLVALLIYEWVEGAGHSTADWYLPLRLQLTAVLTLSLALTLLL